MVKKVLGTVQSVARRVVKANKHYYTSDLLKIIPDELLKWKLKDENLFSVSLMVEKYMFLRMGYLGGMLDYSQEEVFRVGGDLYGKLINLPDDGHLNRKERQLIKEIKFLNSLSMTIAHQ